jgi:hypothetical protein
MRQLFCFVAGSFDNADDVVTAYRLRDPFRTAERSSSGTQAGAGTSSKASLPFQDRRVENAVHLIQQRMTGSCAVP